MTDWSPLHREFDAWRAAGRTIPFWWRDDDAVKPTDNLARLLDVSGDQEWPVHLAVIPARVSDDLPEYLSASTARVLTHGWAHQNHAPPGEKKAEFRDHRPHEDMLDELRRGYARLAERFGAQFCPVFVPPWNRISERVVAALPVIGYRAVSTFTPRRSTFHINTHIDPIDWRGSRSCHSAAFLIEQTVTQLADRRTGKSDALEPLGLLTHHLVHDRAIWDFTTAFLAEMSKGPITRGELP